ncbi:MAG TPA: hypothetical protein DHW11_07660 [Gemmatimonadetes bacterium]|nr:hypothetical protein [Gemmatimonadota bacterium]
MPDGGSAETLPTLRGVGTRMYQMTPWVTRLLIANIGIYLVLSGLPSQLGNSIANALVFRPGSVLQTPWTPVTYMFLHAGFGHLLGNMIGIFFFGPRLEHRLGGKGFLTLYFVAGIGGAFFESVLALFVGPVSMVGASGGVFGILAGFAYYWPRDTILLFPIPIPIQAWLLVSLYMLWSLYAGLSAARLGGGVAHFAHLGGAVIALGFLRWSAWKRGSAKRDFERAMEAPSSGRDVVSEKMTIDSWKGIAIEALHELNREEVERLLDKVDNGGADSLTRDERAFMDRMASN